MRPQTLAGRRGSVSCWVAAVLIAVFTSSSACGGILFFTDADLFAAAVSDGELFLLGIEDFEEANIAFGGAGPMDDPLDANTNSGFFSPGDILDALRIQSNQLGPDAFMEDPTGVAGLYLRNASGGTTSKNVSNNVGSDSLDVITLTPTMAMSFYLITLIDVDLDNVEVDVWSEAGALLGSTITPGSGAGTFLGIVATGGDTLDRVNLFISNDPPSFTWAGVDNVAIYVIPSPGGLALLALFGMAGRRRRR